MSEAGAPVPVPVGRAEVHALDLFPSPADDDHPVPFRGHDPYLCPCHSALVPCHLHGEIHGWLGEPDCDCRMVRDLRLGRDGYQWRSDASPAYRLVGFPDCQHFRCGDEMEERHFDAEEMTELIGLGSARRWIWFQTYRLALWTLPEARELEWLSLERWVAACGYWIRLPDG